MQNNFLYKKIEIENFFNIVEQFKSSIDRHKLNNQDHFNHIDKNSFLEDCALVKEYFDTNNCIIHNIATIELPPKFHGSLHIDSQKNSLALNFPVINCDDSYTSLYKIDSGIPSVVKMENGLTRLSFDDCDAVELTRFYLKHHAVLFNTKIPHQVFNFSDKTRLAISFRFVRDPWHLIF